MAGKNTGSQLKNAEQSKKKENEQLNKTLVAYGGRVGWWEAQGIGGNRGEEGVGRSTREDENIKK